VPKEPVRTGAGVAVVVLDDGFEAARGSLGNTGPGSLTEEDEVRLIAPVYAVRCRKGVDNAVINGQMGSP
jgi:hypothetical protein